MGLLEKILNFFIGSSGSEDDDRTPTEQASLLNDLKGDNITESEALEKVKKFKGNFALQDKDKNTALHIAAKKGFSEVVKMLLEKCRDTREFDNYINIRNEDGDTALHIAAKKGFSKVVKMLLKKQKVLLEKCPNTREFDSKFDGYINARNKDGDTALHIAAKKGFSKVVKMLLEKCPNTREFDNYIDIRNEDGDTALHLATKNSHETVVDILLENDANRITTNYKGETALHLAVEKGDMKVIECFLQPYINFDEKGVQYSITWLDRTSVGLNTTPLHLAAENGHANVVNRFIEVLLPAEEDVNGLYVNVQGLIEPIGKDIDKNKAGKTALDLAAKNGYCEIVESFLRNIKKIRLTKWSYKPNYVFNQHTIFNRTPDYFKEPELLTASVMKKFIQYGYFVKNDFEKIPSKRRKKDPEWTSAAALLDLRDSLFAKAQKEEKEGKEKNKSLDDILKKYDNSTAGCDRYLMLNEPESTAFKKKQRRPAYIFTQDKMFYFDGETIEEIKIVRGKLAKLKTELQITTGYRDNSPKELTAEQLEKISSHNHKVKEQTVEWLCKLRNAQGDSLLYVAVKSGNFDMVKELLEKVDWIDWVEDVKEGQDVLNAAKDELKNREKISETLSSKLNDKSNTYTNNTLKEKRKNTGKENFFYKYLYTNAKVFERRDALFAAAQKTEDDAKEQLDSTLKKYGYGGEAKNKNASKLLSELGNKKGDSLLYVAVKSGNVAMVDALIEKVNWTDWVENVGEGAELLKVANGAVESQKKIEKLISEQSEQQNKLSTFCLNELFAEAEKTDCESSSLENILNKYSNKDFKYRLLKNIAEDGDSLLHLAAKAGNLEVATWLLEKGVNVNTKNTKNGDTALHVAAREGTLKVVEFLLKKGAHIINAQNGKGNTALYEAVNKGNVDIIRVLIENGANTTLWSEAMRTKDKRIIELFLENENELFPENKNIANTTEIRKPTTKPNATPPLKKNPQPRSPPTNEQENYPKPSQ